MGRAAKLQSLFETAMTDFTEQLQIYYAVVGGVPAKIIKIKDESTSN